MQMKMHGNKKVKVITSNDQKLVYFFRNNKLWFKNNQDTLMIYNNE